MDLPSIMQRYGQELGIPTGIPSNAEGAYELPITDELSITVHAIPFGVELSCRLGEFSLERESKFLQELMVANLLGISTRGAVLGLAPDGKNITLQMEMTEELSYQRFMEGYEDFCNVAESWHGNVKGHVQA